MEDNAKYTSHRRRKASRKVPERKVWSYSSTTSGADTIGSLQAIPRAQAATEKMCQILDAPDSTPRMKQYSVSR